jgi:hypothetical protein
MKTNYFPYKKNKTTILSISKVRDQLVKNKKTQAELLKFKKVQEFEFVKTDFDAVSFYKAANRRHLNLDKLMKEHFTN